MDRLQVNFSSLNNDSASISTTSTACSTPLPTPPVQDEAKHVLIVGGGVIGLSIAVMLLRHHSSYQVTLVARDHAFDKQSSPSFASPFAGAVWKTFDDDGTSRQARWEAETFSMWMKMKKQQHRMTDDDMYGATLPFVKDAVLALTETHQQKNHIGVREADRSLNSPWWNDVVLDFEVQDDTQIFRTFTLNPSAYLQALHEMCCASARFSFCVAEVSSLNEARNKFALDADVIVNATGLGALYLSDVADALVEPIRGQTVLLQLTIDDGTTNSLPCFFSNSNAVDDGYSADCFYVVPRAQSGEILLGGTTEVGSFDVEPNERQILRILCDALLHYKPLQQWVSEERCVEQPLPGHTAQHVEEHHMSVNSDNLEARKAALVRSLRLQTGLPIVAVDAGLRPSRQGGPRLELQPSSVTCCSVPIVHAYGFGRSGFQCSLGVAKEVLVLVGQQEQQQQQLHALLKTTN